jgi:hypothetical protein
LNLEIHPIERRFDLAEISFSGPGENTIANLKSSAVAYRAGPDRFDNYVERGCGTRVSRGCRGLGESEIEPHCRKKG